VPGAAAYAGFLGLFLQMAKLYGIKGFQASSIGFIGSTGSRITNSNRAKRNPNIRIPIAIAQIQLRFME
jgi:hypothetical protein